MTDLACINKQLDIEKSMINRGEDSNIKSYVFMLLASKLLVTRLINTYGKKN